MVLLDALIQSISQTDHSLELFSPSAKIAIEELLSSRDGKVYVQCQVRRRNLLAKPEEIVRQFWIHRLVNNYGYSINRLAVEYPVNFGRNTDNKADIVVFDPQDGTTPYAIVEVKRAKQKDGKRQLKSYAHGTGAPLALWSNGEHVVVWHRKNPNYFVEIGDLPSAAQTIEQVINEPWTLETLLDFERNREAEGLGARSLRQLILDMEDEVLANAGVDVFEEVFKLVFTKLYDELSVYRGRYSHLRFRNSNSASELKNQIGDLFKDAREEWEGVFPADDKIRLGAAHLQVCIGSLEQFKLFNSNLDIIDDAFEYLINQSSKGEKGQYFTPRWVIDMCVAMLNPVEAESVIDTACGSAGFTMHTIFKVWNDIMEEEARPASNLFTMEEKSPRCNDYVNKKVFAIDFDEKSVRVARCLNLIAGDGQTNVLHLNTLDFKKWPESIAADEWMDTYGSGWRKIKKLWQGRPGRDDYRDFGFDVVMANPPFAGDIKQSEMLSPFDLAHKTSGQLEAKVARDLLFIERNLDFLRPGGRMAVVLPQGRLNNATDSRVREFIAERCRILAVVGLDKNTFQRHTGTRTSVLFVQKWNDNPEAGPLCEKVDDYNIFFATQQRPSKDSRGEKIIARNALGEPIRDSHGHWVVQHDLFNVEGLTENGIAEAFTAFALAEGMSFAQ